MKILATGDLHGDAVTAGVRRIEEVDAFVQTLITAVLVESIETLFVLGDFFNPGTLRAHELTARLINWSKAIEDRCGKGNCLKRIFWLAGNHDVVESSTGWTVLSPLAEMYQDGGFHYVVERPEFVSFEDWGVLCLPYTSRAVDVSEELNHSFEMAKSQRVVAIGHLSIPGALISSESREMSRGRDVDFPIERVAEVDPVLIFNGHYHQAQSVETLHGTIHCPGSPLRLNFGERNDTDKGYIIAEI